MSTWGTDPMWCERRRPLNTRGRDPTFATWARIFDILIECVHMLILLPTHSNEGTGGEGAVFPLLAAKQRFTHRNDWMTTDAEIACPDPNCKSRLRIVRTGLRTFRHGEVTAVLLE